MEVLLIVYSLCRSHLSLHPYLLFKLFCQFFLSYAAKVHTMEFYLEDLTDVHAGLCFVQKSNQCFKKRFQYVRGLGAHNV